MTATRTLQLDENNRLEVGPGWASLVYERKRLGCFAILGLSFWFGIGGIFAYLCLLMVSATLFGIGGAKSDNPWLAAALTGLPAAFMFWCMWSALIRRHEARLSRSGDEVRHERLIQWLCFRLKRVRLVRRAEASAKISFSWFGTGYATRGGRGGWRYTLDIMLKGRRHWWVVNSDGGVRDVPSRSAMLRAAQEVAEALQAADVIDRIEFGKPYVDKGIPGAPQS